MARLDVLYAHIEDPAVPLGETVEAFAALVAEGTVGLLGVSNHWAWRVERARSLAAAAGVPGYEVLQYHYSYLRPRAVGQGNPPHRATLSARSVILGSTWMPSRTRCRHTWR